MKKRIFSLLLAMFLGWTAQLNGQEFLSWDILADVTFENEFSEDYGMDILSATFGEWVLAMDGKEVTLTGFMIPIDAMGTAYVLSRNPNSSCFFCGGAGPETIVGLRMKPEYIKRYKTDEYLTFKGILELNEKNDRSFTYVLKEAERL